MTEILPCTILALVGAAGTAVVLTRAPENQAIGLSFFGLLLAVMFTVFQEPDVALSQIVIGAVGLPLMLLLAITCLRRHESAQEKGKGGRE